MFPLTPAQHHDAERVRCRKTQHVRGRRSTQIPDADPIHITYQTAFVDAGKLQSARTSGRDP
jgi:hypothetical protein